MLSLSRIFDQETSRTSVIFSPSAAAYPLPTATIRAAASISGMKPMWSGSFVQELRCRQDRLCDLGDLLFLAHRGRPQQDISLLFRQPLSSIRMPLARSMTFRSSSTDLGTVEFILQFRKSVEARNAEIEDRFQALLLQAVDDISGDTGIDGSLDRGGIALIDEHGDRPSHRPADLKHLLQDITAGIFEIDHDDIRIDQHR